jgi:hypothetical protein
MRGSPQPLNLGRTTENAFCRTLCHPASAPQIHLENQKQLNLQQHAALKSTRGSDQIARDQRPEQQLGQHLQLNFLVELSRFFPHV